jgi:exocyst complex component 3
MGDIKEGMDETEVNIKDLNSLTDSLVEVKEETARYSQLGTAQENLNKLINVPEIVKDTENAIFEDRLLEAHKALSEVEQSRDELLFELHRLQQKQHSSVDKDLLNEYFIDASKLSVKLEKKLNSILGTTLNTVRQNPKVIVTALRIIEREEKLDAEHQYRLKSTGFLPPGRPKCWRSKCMEKLKQHVLDTIEGLQLEDDREQNKMWLVRYLELIRIQTQKDLRIAKTLCVPVFPPSYKILEMYINIYHEAISQRLSGIISNGLEDQEDVTVLQWIIQTYPGEDLLQGWNLQIPPTLIKPLLDELTLERLKQEYLDKKEGEFKEWMKRALELETKDWRKESNEPEKDENDKYQTSFARTVFLMVDQNLQVAETISQELTTKLFVRSLEQFICITQDYCGAIKTFKGYYFLDRSKMSPGQFTRFMVAIVNNSELSQELSQVHRTKWLKPGQQDNDSAVKLEKLLDCYNNLKETAFNILLDEVFLDLGKAFKIITTPDWGNETEAIGTIVSTLAHCKPVPCNDYRDLPVK